MYLNASLITADANTLLRASLTFKLVLNVLLIDITQKKMKPLE